MLRRRLHRPGSPVAPRTADDIRELVLKLARENSWGYTRILGELRKLGIRSVSRQTVKMILKEHDIDPGPQRGKGSWDEFLKIHVDTLWQCDFLSKPMWTAKGLVDVYLLVFLHLGSRRVWISPSTVQRVLGESQSITRRVMTTLVRRDGGQSCATDGDYDEDEDEDEDSE